MQTTKVSHGINKYIDQSTNWETGGKKIKERDKIDKIETRV